MRAVAILTGSMLMVAAHVALAQAPNPTTTPPTTQTQTPPPPVAAPVAPPSQAAAARPLASRYGSISGSWLMPNGDFDKFASDGWAITLEGYQFITPTRKIAVGTQVAYQSFGKKNGVTVSNFPVDAVLRFYPKPGTGKLDVYGLGGLGFNYQRVDVGYATNTDYLFGTQAGAGVELHTNGPASFLVDGVYHWVFASGTDTNFIAWRAGLVIPMMR